MFRCVLSVEGWEWCLNWTFESVVTANGEFCGKSVDASWAYWRSEGLVLGVVFGAMQLGVQERRRVVGCAGLFRSAATVLGLFLS